MMLDLWKNFQELSLNDPFACWFYNAPNRRRSSIKGMRQQSFWNDKGEYFEFILEVPGVKGEDIKIESEGDVLMLSIKRELAREENSSLYLSERRAFDFKQSYRLPESVNSSAIEAGLKDGILRLTLPKLAKAKAQQIVVTSY